MTRFRAVFATLVCVAFLAVSAGTVAAHDYDCDNENGSSCVITVTGVPDGGSVSVKYGERGLVSDDTFSARNGKTIKVRAEVGRLDGPWIEYEVQCDGELDVTDWFCNLTVEGIPDGGAVYIKGIEGALENDQVLLVPDGAYFKSVAAVGSVYGRWESGTFDCEALNGVLDFASRFCSLEVSGIPESCALALIDIDGIGEDLDNGDTFSVPDGACIEYRATVEGITGPWRKVKVDCEESNGLLDTSSRWVDVQWILKWTDEGQTLFRDSELTVANGDSYCFPKDAKVYARPDITPATDWDRMDFDEDSIVYWKVISVEVELDDCSDR